MSGLFASAQNPTNINITHNATIKRANYTF